MYCIRTYIPEIYYTCYPYVRLVCMEEYVGKQLYKKLNKKVSLFGSYVEIMEMYML